MKNNIPAFPSEIMTASEAYHVSFGMTLRDYFAGQALAEVMISMKGQSNYAKKVACCAYDIADAMLKERERV